MSQNHTNSDGILERNKINHTTLNTVCQNHGNAPSYYKFGAQKGICDLGRTYLHAYTTWPLQTHIYIVTYYIYHFSSTYKNSFLYHICRYIILTSLAHRLLIIGDSSSRFPSRPTSSSRLPSRTTHCIILPTNGNCGCDAVLLICPKL